MVLIASTERRQLAPPASPNSLQEAGFPESMLIELLLQAGATVMANTLIADMIAIAGSLDTVMGEVDR